MTQYMAKKFHDFVKLSEIKAIVKESVVPLLKRVNEKESELI